MKGKKGEVEAQKVTVSLLVLIIIVLFLAFFSARVFEFMTSKGDIESCRLSVVASGKISDVSMGISTLDLECPRKNIVFSPDSYTIDEGERDYASENEEDYSDNVKQVFADEMRECWYKMGEGEVDLFSNVAGTSTQCIVCSTLSFENPPETDIGNLMTYIQETTIPVSVQTQEQITYYDYLYREAGEGALGMELSPRLYISDDGEISTKNPYSVIFYRIQVESGGNSLAVIPNTRLESYCSYLYT